MTRQSRRRLRRSERRQVFKAVTRACRESGSPEEAQAKAEAICRDEYGFVETLIVALIVKAITYLIPIIWNWIKNRKSDDEIEAFLTQDAELGRLFGDGLLGDESGSDPHD